MKIDKADWEKFKARYGNRAFASYTRAGLYAMCSVRRKTLYVHRGIYDTNLPDIDHINGNGLDNRRANLRGCTHSENLANRPATRINTSGCSGVSWHRRRGKWQAKLTKRGKQIYLGLFTNLADAIRAREAAKVEYFGKFAHSANCVRSNDHKKRNTR